MVIIIDSSSARQANTKAFSQFLLFDCWKLSFITNIAAATAAIFVLIDLRIVCTAGIQNLWLLLNLQESQVHSISPHESPGLTIRTSEVEQ